MIPHRTWPRLSVYISRSLEATEDCETSDFCDGCELARVFVQRWLLDPPAGHREEGGSTLLTDLWDEIGCFWPPVNLTDFLVKTCGDLTICVCEGNALPGCRFIEEAWEDGLSGSCTRPMFLRSSRLGSATTVEAAGSSGLKSSSSDESIITIFDARSLLGCWLTKSSSSSSAEEPARLLGCLPFLAGRFLERTGLPSKGSFFLHRKKNSLRFYRLQRNRILKDELNGN